MHAADVLARVAAELSLFSDVGFLLFGLNDLAVDAIYFARRLWRSLTVYRRHRRAYASPWQVQHGTAPISRCSPRAGFIDGPWLGA